MRFAILLLLGFGLSIHSLSAQRVLALENPYRAKRIFLYPGDYIEFKTHDGNAKYSGYIEAVYDSVIVLVKAIKIGNEGDATNKLMRDYVPIEEIKYLYGNSKSYWQFFRKMVAGTGTIGGAYLLGTTTFNRYYLDSPMDPTSVTIASALLGTGILFALIGKDRRRMGRRWRLRSMDVL